jgi:hypothetical protein
MLPCSLVLSYTRTTGTYLVRTNVKFGAKVRRELQREYADWIWLTSGMWCHLVRLSRNNISEDFTASGFGAELLGVTVKISIPGSYKMTTVLFTILHSVTSQQSSHWESNISYAYLCLRMGANIGIQQQARRMASSGMLRRVALVRTVVSEEFSASIIRVTRISELGTSASN